VAKSLRVYGLHDVSDEAPRRCNSAKHTAPPANHDVVAVRRNRNSGVAKEPQRNGQKPRVTDQLIVDEETCLHAPDASHMTNA